MLTQNSETILCTTKLHSPLCSLLLDVLQNEFHFTPNGSEKVKASPDSTRNSCLVWKSINKRSLLSNS